MAGKATELKRRRRLVSTADRLRGYQGSLKVRFCVRTCLAGVILVAAVAVSASIGVGESDATAPWMSGERASVILGEGKRGIYRWRSELRSAGKLNGGKLGALCINTVVFEPTEGSELENCGSVPGRGILEVSRAGTKVRPITVLSMVFNASARSVYLKRLGRAGHTFPLRRLGAGKLTSISDVPLSTFAHAFGGRFCLERYAAYDSSGNAVADSGRRHCDSR